MDQNSPEPSRVKIADLINSLVAALAVITIVVAFLVASAPLQSLLMNIGASLIIVPSLYLLTRNYLIDLSAPRINEFFGMSDQIFRVGQSYLSKKLSKHFLKPKGRVVVRLYAPVGIWYDCDAKDEWLEQLAAQLQRGNVHLIGVFGLPPKSEQDFSDKNSKARTRLEKFKDLPSVHLRCLPPPVEYEGRPMPVAPGLGYIIFDDDIAIHGLAPEQADTAVTRGQVIEGEKGVKPLKEWFDEQFLKGRGSIPLVYNSDTKVHPAEFEAAIDKIIEAFYSQPAPSGSNGKAMYMKPTA